MGIAAQVTTLKLFITTTFYTNDGWNYQSPPMQSENSSCEVLTFQLRFKMCVETQDETVLRPSLKKVNTPSRTPN